MPSVYQKSLTGVKLATAGMFDAPRLVQPPWSEDFTACVRTS
jgi:hypothetical protein